MEQVKFKELISSEAGIKKWIEHLSKTRDCLWRAEKKSRELNLFYSEDELNVINEFLLGVQNRISAAMELLNNEIEVRSAEIDQRKGLL